ncbi:MAG: sulfotransferase [Bacteroidota bacterium]
MKNDRPIFLNCYSRGGSNILWNLFLTHPDVCSPIRETLDIFYRDLPRPRREGVTAALLARQWGLFDQWNLAPRGPVPGAAQRYIDRMLFEWKMKTLEDDEMRLKAEGEAYTREEVERSRLVAKNNNGLTFLSDLFGDMYPGATFFALVRHPVPLYESHRRRNLTDSVESFASFYRAIATRMLNDAERMERYHVLRFGDVLADPVAVMHELYAKADLDPSHVTKVRLKAKPHLTPDGQQATGFTVGEHYWFEPENVHALLDPNVNTYSAELLTKAEQDRLLALTADVRARLGYAEYEVA